MLSDARRPPTRRHPAEPHYSRGMTESGMPIINTFTYRDFAALSATVTHLSPIDGNSGHSSIRFDVEAGSIWLGTEDRDSDSQRDFTIQLQGSSEHHQLAKAFREIAEQLDAAPERGEG